MISAEARSLSNSMNICPCGVTIWVVLIVRSLNEQGNTLPETNIAPENRVSQKACSFPTTIFQGRAVSFREGTNFPPNRVEKQGGG